MKVKLFEDVFIDIQKEEVSAIEYMTIANVVKSVARVEAPISTSTEVKKPRKLYTFKDGKGKRGPYKDGKVTVTEREDGSFSIDTKQKRYIYSNRVREIVSYLETNTIEETETKFNISAATIKMYRYINKLYQNEIKKRDSDKTE